MKRSFQVIFIIAAFALGVFLTHWYFARNSQPIESSTVVLEHLKAVTKLITVEGQFSEIYDYSNYTGDFPMFWDKKALVRVQAKVSAGYDLNTITFDVDEEQRTLTVHQLPKASILSVDHQLSYYNIQEGLFTSFSTSDHNEMQARAKKFILEKAQQSSLLPRAEQEGQESLKMIAFMLKGMGWTLVLDEGSPMLLQ